MQEPVNLSVASQVEGQVVFVVSVRGYGLPAPAPASWRVS